MKESKSEKERKKDTPVKKEGQAIWAVEYLAYLCILINTYRYYIDVSDIIRARLVLFLQDRLSI